MDNIDVIPHFTCRDRSLLGTQADLLGAHSLGIHYLLVTTGDPPKHGPYDSKAVYELLEKIHAHVDGIHIMAMGDVNGTNRILEYIESLKK